MKKIIVLCHTCARIGHPDGSLTRSKRHDPPTPARCCMCRKTMHTATAYVLHDHGTADAGQFYFDI